MPYLYPQIHEYTHYFLDVDDTHKLYVEECGNPEGVPIVFLHGGPGAGCEAYHRCFFDPEAYRIILFDQRGCGRSTPHSELNNNTTQHLVGDLEKIRQHLGLQQWALFGGSWGSTLALAYAETYPEYVSGLIVRGIFLCTPKELEWLYQDGASRVYPDYWDDFLEPIPEDERDDLLKAYYQLLTGEDEIAKMRSAKAWSTWEGRTATLLPNEDLMAHFTDPHTALSVARIETHYFINEGFLEEGQLLKNADKLRGIPGYIIQGRYDMICPMEQAYRLHQAWPEANFAVVANAGHAASEEGIISALVSATNSLLKQL
ncbi:MAG: Proline iminopeptidase (EC [uncultured Thiotrichaceae bacterium]|uniref:Proline iminopeptidase n=1 Tax=uncultured Thiotrichaceae bacterium TaxID=298394 RepID=A0A6S6TIP0_9GAMM|nr:MAG: Proline iminopeptidase (EC [uncultured Thiotrichaceae bacterium]